MYISIYVYIYSCIYLFMYISIHVYIYLCMYVCIYLFMYISIHVYIYLCIYLFMYISIYVYIYLCIYLFMYISIYVYIYLVSEQSERDTLRNSTIENRGCLFIYMFGRTYVILYFDPRVFLCCSVFDPRPKLH